MAWADAEAPRCLDPLEEETETVRKVFKRCFDI
jgi:hypothetical protein